MKTVNPAEKYSRDLNQGFFAVVVVIGEAKKNFRRMKF